MKALLVLLLLLAATRGWAQPFACTEVVGFSQTRQWYVTSTFTAAVGDDAWQLRGQSAGDLDVWADIRRWNVPLESPCRVFSTAPDRVILTITLGRYEGNVATWVRELRETIATLRRFHPQARQIVLQPVVGGPGNRTCPHPNDPIRGVRASYNHPRIDAAIAEVVHDAPDLAAGASPEVQFCGQYRDVTGHLTEPARPIVGARIGLFYAMGEPPTSTTTPPGPTTSTTLGPHWCRLLGQICETAPCCPGQGTCRTFPWGRRCWQ